MGAFYEQGGFCVKYFRESWHAGAPLGSAGAAQRASVGGEWGIKPRTLPHADLATSFANTVGTYRHHNG